MNVWDKTSLWQINNKQLNCGSPKLFHYKVINLTLGTFGSNYGEGAECAFKI